MKLFYSKELSELLCKLRENGSEADVGDGCCTLGHDNDGSTGYEIFENGINLAHMLFKRQEAEQRSLGLFYGKTDEVATFFIAGTKEEAIERLKEEIEA